MSRLLSNVMPGFGREAVASNRLFFIWWKVLFIALLIVIIVSISSVFMWGDLFVYSTWADRALMRSHYLLENFQFGGAELNTGGKSPGSFYYILLKFLLAFTDNPLVIHRIVLVGFAASVLAVYVLCRRFVDPLPALCGAALMIGSRPMNSILFQISNPAFTPLLGVFIWWVMVEIISERRARLLPVFTLLVVMAGQIHMSFYLLVPALTLAMATRRIKPDTKHILLSIVVALVFLGPYAINEWLYSAANSTAMIDVYSVHINPFSHVLPDVIRKFLFTNLGFYSSDFSAMLEFSPLKLITASILSIGFISVVLLWVIGRVFQRIYVEDDARRRAILLLVAISTAIMLTTFLLSGVTAKPRRYLFIQPGYVLLVAILAQSLLYRGKLSARNSTLLATIIVVLISATALTNSHVQRLSWPDEFPLYRDVVNIVSVGQNDFGFNRMSLQQGVLLLIENPDGTWVGKPSTWSASFNFLTKGGPDGPPNHRCLAVFRSKNKTRLSDADFKEALKKILPINMRPTIVGKIVRKERFSMVEFATSQDNCPRTFNNRYLPTEEERELEGAPLSKEKATVTLPIREQDEIGRIAFLIPNTGIRAMIILRDDGNGFVAELHSRKLRGYDGIAHYALQFPRLVLKHIGESTNSVDLIISLYDGWLGSSKLAITPWRSEQIKLGAGQYDAVFRINAYELPDGSQHSVPIDIPLNHVIRAPVN